MQLLLPPPRQELALPFPLMNQESSFPSLPMSQESSFSSLPMSQEFPFPPLPMMSQDLTFPTLPVSQQLPPTPIPPVHQQLPPTPIPPVHQQLPPIPTPVSQQLSPTPTPPATPNTTLTTKVVIATKQTGIPSCEWPRMSGDLLTSGEISQLFLKSCSRKNFATLLVKRLFPEEVRKISNVSGKDKQKLDPSIIEYVKDTTFVHWPLAQSEKTDKEWGECKIAIDEANRRLNRPAKKKK